MSMRTSKAGVAHLAADLSVRSVSPVGGRTLLGFFFAVSFGATRGLVYGVIVPSPEALIAYLVVVLSRLCF